MKPADVRRLRCSGELRAVLYRIERAAARARDAVGPENITAAMETLEGALYELAEVSETERERFTTLAASGEN